jgi:hypothetical protein
MTSYRKEGLIVKDAILDIENLIEYVKKTIGKTEMILLEGESMVFENFLTVSGRCNCDVHFRAPSSKQKVV